MNPCTTLGICRTCGAEFWPGRHHEYHICRTCEEIAAGLISPQSVQEAPNIDAQPPSESPWTDLQFGEKDKS